MVRPVLLTAWRVVVEGLENIPSEGPAIIAPNHTAAIDSFFIPAVLPRRIIYVGKSEYLDDWKTRRLFPALGMIPIDRSGGDASQRALATAKRVLERGELFGIYPEGTRSRTGRLHKGHTGMARLAIETGAPIVPVGIIGTREIQPPEVSVPLPLKRVQIRFGAAIDPHRYATRADDRLALRQLTDEVMFEIRELSGQEYDPTYATKGATPSAPPPDVIDVTAAADRRSSSEVLRPIASDAPHAEAG
ncbi:1-acyl-sn-glycerol-3-phosphate acyltransferase [Actinomarinicola tropica]|uniref:1-acyl-sn-glycerol-3-phosphate acyltransferase n=1 Tax=Actinomarinicola tropica TaxID=2789776 RepID=A0A5Q2RPY2_9ACTN|nr:1-acyl-sn-glycerol-3-phosphate acyltransferase [Actinomarinicola tropica]